MFLPILCESPQTEKTSGGREDTVNPKGLRDPLSGFVARLIIGFLEALRHSNSLNRNEKDQTEMDKML